MYTYTREIFQFYNDHYRLLSGTKEKRFKQKAIIMVKINFVCASIYNFMTFFMLYSEINEMKNDPFI